MRALPVSVFRDAHRRTLAVFTVLLGLLLGMLAVLALPASARADVDDFDYSSWTSRYDLSLDDEGRAVAHVTETLVADFPDFDQNKGIVRGYPQRYEGAGLDLDIRSVTDENGRDVPYETEDEDGVTYLLLGDDSYVHGRTTYVIEYTMRDVMLAGTKTKSDHDEFYWDLLPLDSTQDIHAFTGEVRVAPELAAALTGDTACYQGWYGSKDRCELAGPAEVDGGARFTVRAGELDAGDGVTVAIGFASGTVTQPPARQPNAVADDVGPVTVAGGALAALAASIGTVIVARRRRRTATGVIVAQYDVPEELPPLLAAPLIPGAKHTLPAQFVHLAVRGALRIDEQPAKKKSGKSQPTLHLLNREAAATELDMRTLAALFPGDKTERTIPVRSEKFAKAMAKLVAGGVASAEQRHWTTKQRLGAAVVPGVLALVMLGAAIAFLIWSLALNRDTLPIAVIAVLFAIVVSGIAATVAFAKHTVFTPAGAERHEYLMGVAEFIRVAEADRIRMLQSYTGAERRSDGSVDTVVLYERLLPYAMLLGEEDSWGEVLQSAYTAAGSDPSWTSQGSAVHFGGWLTTFSSTTQSAGTYTSSSSSSGGSSGGGFSGGGGGGGFSGGR